jgi:integrase
VTSNYEAAVDARIVGRNPVKTRSVKKNKPKVATHKVAAWSAVQVQAVAAELPERLVAMAYLGAVTGMRQGELFGLAFDDIEFLPRMVNVSVQVIQLGTGLAFAPIKNDKTKHVPVAGNVVPLLSQHYEKFGAPAVTLPWSDRGDRKKDGKPVTRRLLFADPQGTAWFKQTVNRQWHKGWKAAGIPDLGRANGMHVLRHTAASHWLSKGLNVAKVADYLGDTVAMVWKTYSHYMPADHELGRAIMDGFLDPSGEGSGASERPHSALGGA